MMLFKKNSTIGTPPQVFDVFMDGMEVERECFLMFG